ncbi:MAG: flagellar M-ring protein FliF [Syntrophomonadaceae bacterium]|nr:flagellar M-ring protein FliF [Syntrophomonadaceae bacterium]
MESFFEKVKQKLTLIAEYWSKLNLTQKVLFGGVSLLVCIIIVALLVSDKQAYEVLYADLNSKDAAQVIEKLDEYKVPYKLENDGTTILVPFEAKNETRLKLAGENLPQSDSGFELFQESAFAETQMDKRVKYQMALQGELARTIQSINKVRAAKVNLVLPEDSLFIQSQQIPKASVVINTYNNDSLSAPEVNSIINLVANSVQGLSKEDVVIVDQNGTLLSDGLLNEGYNLADNVRVQQAMKREFEREKQSVIQNMLDKALGKDNSVVVVSADLNFDNKEEKAEQYYHDEGGPHVRSESVDRASTEENSTGTADVPGTDTNIPQYAEVNNGVTSSGTSDSSSRTTNYEISSTETLTKYSVGDVKYDYLTVTVLVNSRADIGNSLGASEQQRMNTIRSLVASATGLRENRPNENVRLEDNISVAFVDFVPEAAEAETSPLTAWERVLDRPYLLAAVVLVLALLGVGLLRFIRSKRKVADESIEEGVFDTIIEEDVELKDIFEKVMTPEEKEYQKIKEEIEKFIENDPENAANAIKNWMMEDLV